MVKKNYVGEIYTNILSALLYFKEATWFKAQCIPTQKPSFQAPTQWEKKKKGIFSRDGCVVMRTHLVVYWIFSILEDETKADKRKFDGEESLFSLFRPRE